MRKEYFITLLCLIIYVCPSWAQEAAMFRDNVSNVTFPVPEKSKIEHHSGFHKATIELEKTNIDVYSMKNDDKKKYSWDQVNTFDANNKYGSLLKYEKMPNDIDGWIRYYTGKTKNGHNYVTCVVLVRGKDYAFYMTESAYKETDLSMTGILEQISFANATVEKKKSKAYYWFVIIVTAVLGGISLIFFHSVKKMQEKKYITLAVIMTIITALWSYFAVDLGWGLTILVAIFTGVCWALVRMSKSRSEAFNKLMDEISKNT